MSVPRMTALAAALAALAIGPRVAGAQQTEPPTPGEMGGATYGMPEEAAPAPTPGPDEAAPEAARPPAMEAPMAMPVEEEPSYRETYVGRYGLTLAVGGGVTDFTGSAADDITDTGGSWDARVVLGTRTPIAIEGAYIGSAQDIGTLGLSPDTLLVSNGAEANLRLNLSTGDVQPFLFGGAAWQRFELVNEDFNTSSVSGSDDVFAIPVGAGLAVRTRVGFTFDARFTYRQTFNEDLIRSPNDPGADTALNNWGVSGRIGYEF